MASLNKVAKVSSIVNNHNNKKSNSSENVLGINKYIPLTKRKAEKSPNKNKCTKRPALNEITNGKLNIKTRSVSKAEKSISTRSSVNVRKKLGTITSSKPLLKTKSFKQNGVNQTSQITAIQEIKSNVVRQVGTKDNLNVKPAVPFTSVNNNSNLKKLPVKQEKSTQSEKISPSQSEKLLKIVVDIPRQLILDDIKEEPEIEPKVIRRSTRISLSRKSLSAEKSAENGSLYVSALEDVSSISIKENEVITKRRLGPELSEFDKELLNDPHQVSVYAMEIFEYLKSREKNFLINDYMIDQPNITKNMRAVLVDWMVDVQESFALNHETLYLSVKIVDSYLCKEKINKNKLQLVGAAALFLSSKYDERSPPLMDEFVYIADYSFTQNDLLAMEQSILKTLNFELGFPISYSFLRRYARCARIQMPLLTLARYILELSLMEYSTVTLSDSKQAAAALYLAFQMANHSDWTESLTFYTGYNVEEFKDIVLLFNSILHREPHKDLLTVRTKYSHELFFKVAAIPLISDGDLKL